MKYIPKIGIEYESCETSETLKQALVSDFDGENNRTAYLDARLASYSSRNYRDWLIKSDASCGLNGGTGSEIVSPPTSFDNTAQLDMFFNGLKAMTELSGCYDNPKYFEKCGIHVHVEADLALSKSVLNRQMSSVFAAYDRRWDNILGFVGRGRDPEQSSHAERYCGRSLGARDKYSAVNALNVFTLNHDCPTVEFRQLGVCRQISPRKFEIVSGEDIVAWCMFVTGIMVAVRNPAGLFRTGCLDTPQFEYHRRFVTKASEHGFDTDSVVERFNFLTQPSLTEVPV